MGTPDHSLREIDYKRLSECHPDLERIVLALNYEMPVMVLCGHRNEEEQNAAFAAGKSKLTFPHSAHNKLPSLAIDVCPYPVDWNDRTRFLRMQSRARKIAQDLGIKLTPMLQWDLPHIQLAP